MRARRRPWLLAPGAPLEFPNPRHADADGIVAIGGDLSQARLLLAYESGIFPWYDAGLPPLWWSPDPRAVFERECLHVSRSLRRELRRTRFRLSFDRAFTQVLRHCADRPETGTWILPEMIAAYEQLHTRGQAHSFEVWEDEELVGGLYGVQRAGLFAAESMFHRRDNASKVALVASVVLCFRAGIEVYDVQFLTPHLRSMGATSISRAEYLTRLSAALDRGVDLGGVCRPVENPGQLV
jgi:leucyl/phenylalanyl-tRNA---protein transferase